MLKKCRSVETSSRLGDSRPRLDEVGSKKRYRIYLSDKSFGILSVKETAIRFWGRMAVTQKEVEGFIFFREKSGDMPVR